MLKIDNHAAAQNLPSAATTADTSPERMLANMHLAYPGQDDASHPWSPENLPRRCDFGGYSLPSLPALSPKKVGGACMRLIKPMRLALPKLETRKTREARQRRELQAQDDQRLQDEFAQEAEDMLAAEPDFDLGPAQAFAEVFANLDGVETKTPRGPAYRVATVQPRDTGCRNPAAPRNRAATARG